MLEENMYVGKILKGKEVFDTSADSKFMYFYFEDGSFDVSPIIDGIVSVTFDEDSSEEEDISKEEGDSSADPLANTEEELELGFYKTLEPIPYTDEEGNEIGVTEVESIQEVPVALGDFWVAEGWAEKTDVPVAQTLGQKIGKGISEIFNKS